MGAAPCLKLFQEGKEIKEVAIEGDLFIGRSEKCQLRLEGRAVSREHAMLRVVDGNVQVQRKSEFAPLHINGAEATSVVLKDGDQIQIGQYELKIVIPPKELATMTELSQDSIGFETVSDDAQEQHFKGEFSPAPQTELKLSLESTIDSAYQDQPPSSETGLETIGQFTMVDPDKDAIQGTALPTMLPTLNATDLQTKNETVVLSDSNDAGTQVTKTPELEFGENIYSDPMATSAPEAVSSSIELVAPSAFEADQKSQEAASSGASVTEISQDPPQLAALSVPVESSLNSQGSFKTGPQTGSGSQTQALTENLIQAKIYFEPGAADVQEFEIRQPETVMGRSRSCDITLTDVKASRRNTAILMDGTQFFVKDLESANGTYLNGVRVTSKMQLSTDDVIKIGDTEIRFKAVSAEYERQQEALPERKVESTDDGFDGAGFPDAYAAGGLESPGGYQAAAHPSMNQGMSQAGPMVDGALPPTSIAYWRDQLSRIPKRRLMIWGLLLACVALVMMEPTEESGTPSEKTISKDKDGKTTGRTFEKLSKDRKEYVKSQFNLAFGHFQNQEFDKAIFEVNKIFEFVDDYKEGELGAKDLLEYANVAKERLGAIQADEEKKKKEEENRIKIDELTEEVTRFMLEKKFDVAEKLFTQILDLDPENKNVEKWRSAIQEYQNELAFQAQRKELDKQVNAQALTALSEARALQNKGNCSEAIAAFNRIVKDPPPDRTIVSKAKAGAAQCRRVIEDKVAPLLAEADAKEKAGEVTESYKFYRQVTEIDPPNKTAYEGIMRLYKALQERAKVSYTEAVLAESYSDFELAKKKFIETMEIVPPGDLYHERAKRKLTKFVPLRALSSEPGK